MADHNPFLFAVGCPRSGTTLLQRILDAHPDLTVTNDSHFIPRALEIAAPATLPLAAAGARVPLSSALVEAALAYHRFPRLGLELPEARQAARHADDYASFVAELYRRVAARAGKALAGEKTPDYVRWLPHLHGLFPHARFVHIHRDGRDVAMSLIQWAHASKGPGRLPLWREQPLATAILWWRWQVRSGRDDAARLPKDRVLAIGYDDLVQLPDESVQRLCGFLGLPFHADMLAFHRGRSRNDPGLSAKSAWLPPTAGLRDWRTQMPLADIALCEALAGDELEALGYSLAVDHTPPAIRDLATRCREWWDLWLAQRADKANARGSTGGPPALRT